ncbi:MAG: cytochrome c3 family protein [Nannocystaceae bacterium]|nr:cytochrome c3 family protein [bacterium]
MTMRNGSTWALVWTILFSLVAAASAGPKEKPTTTAPMGRTPTMVGGGNGPRERANVPTTVGVMHGPTRRGSAVYPLQTIPISFNHGQHLKIGMDCVQCHTDIDGSRRAADNNFPRGKVCDTCHGPQHPKPRTEPAKCSLCHTKVDTVGGKQRVTAGLRAPKPLLKFNHALHDKAGSDCEDCHGDMSRVRLATVLQLPDEQSCLECHDGIGATDACSACHPTQSSGKLQTRAIDDRSMPALIPKADNSWGAAHDLAFVEDHAHISKANPTLCQSCHEESFCTDCHAGVIRPMRIHSGDFINTHALDARAQTSNCQSCHRTQSFCLGCHERMGFNDEPGSAFGVGGSLSFHPDGWAGPPGMPQGHAHAAQRNMAACSSCHTEDSCLACHATAGGAVGGLGANPHGTRFRNSARCNALATRNRRVCLKCHAPGDPQLDCL